MHCPLAPADRVVRQKTIKELSISPAISSADALETEAVVNACHFEDHDQLFSMTLWTCFFPFVCPHFCILMILREQWQFFENLLLYIVSCNPTWMLNQNRVMNSNSQFKLFFRFFHSFSLCRMGKISGFLTIFGIKSIRYLFLDFRFLLIWASLWASSFLSLPCKGKKISRIV